MRRGLKSVVESFVSSCGEVFKIDLKRGEILHSSRFTLDLYKIARIYRAFLNRGFWIAVLKSTVRQLFVISFQAPAIVSEIWRQPLSSTSNSFLTNHPVFQHFLEFPIIDREKSNPRSG